MIVSSHLLHEIEQISTRMLIIDEGKKMVEGTVASLMDPSKTLVEAEVTRSRGRSKPVGTYRMVKMDSENYRYYIDFSITQRTDSGFEPGTGATEYTGFIASGKNFPGSLFFILNPE